MQALMNKLPSPYVDGLSEDEKNSWKGWYFFDWANQAYALTVMTVIAPALMASLYNKATGTQTGDSFYATVLTLSMLFVIVTAPALGVIADRMPIKKKLLKWYTVVGIAFTALMGAAPYFGSDGYMILAMMFTIGTIGFTGGNVIYYSFMPYLGKREDQDKVSTWGYMYGFMGGSILLIFHLIILLGEFWDTNFTIAVVFVTSALWWWGFGALMFKWTPEPEIVSDLDWENLGKNNFSRFIGAATIAYGQVWKTAIEIRKFKVLAFFLIAYLLFYDGVNTIAAMASAFGESVLRLNPSMNVMLLLTVNIVAIPMTFVFGKLAEKKGTKFALMLALLIYCAVAVAAAGFAPLELEGEKHAERYDFQFEWNEETELYEMTTLYNRGYEGWIAEDSEGDAAFRDAFQNHFPVTDYSVEDAGESTLGTGLIVCLFILVLVVLLGGGLMWLQEKNLGWMGIFAAFLLVGVGIFGASFLAGQATEDVEDVKTISETKAEALVAAFDDVDNHRFSIIIVGGSENSTIAGASEVGNTHPTIVDQGGPVDGWASTMRSMVWAPLGISVSLQWIILGLFVGCAMGSAGAQARSMFSQLTPKTRTSEFFGFFGFLGKSAAMIGTALYAIASTTFDSRVALLSITVVILAGTFVASRVDLDEGIRVAQEEDARNSGELVSEEVIE
ncbi:MAG TPA: MFS transporter [Candidatus Thalassarchaeaceae archaeon]|jgi:UMF1 family MFS transporter|nr:MFS transporter [Candidatus Thalassarchaeaceae archaeon]DAC49285.1 MAG TPA: MFS transporter [Candidatus Poseidoniales archaeon]HIH83391.1 MFS transporter [Candidatus Thalassarchaeaceae archaeon]|tara:strand:+ start:891 stop:2909 length:2019 start_codon:yes stop_codon:yes gene_type:complete